MVVGLAGPLGLCAPFDVAFNQGVRVELDFFERGSFEQLFGERFWKFERDAEVRSETAGLFKVVDLAFERKVSSFWS